MRKQFQFLIPCSECTKRRSFTNWAFRQTRMMSSLSTSLWAPWYTGTTKANLGHNIYLFFFCLGHLMGSQKMSTAWKNKNMNKWKGRIPTPKSIVKFLHFFNVYWLSEVYLNDIVCGGGMKSTIKLLNTLQIFAFKIIVLSWNKSIQFST